MIMFERFRERRAERRRHEARRPPAGPSTRSEPSGDRPKVLVEYPSFGTPSVLADILDRAGYDPIVCEAPGDAPDACRLLETGSCPWAAEADIVFNGFGLGTEEHRRIIEALRTTYPETPLVVESPAMQADAHEGLLTGCTRCDSPLDSKRLLDAVAGARRAGTAPTVP